MRRITSSYRQHRQCLHRLTRYRRAYCSYSSSKTVISTLDSYQTSSTTNISTFVRCQHSVKCKHAINEISKQKHRKPRCFCSLETASNIPREHSHARKRQTMRTYANFKKYERMRLTVIAKTSRCYHRRSIRYDTGRTQYQCKRHYPVLLLFDGKHKL